MREWHTHIHSRSNGGLLFSRQRGASTFVKEGGDVSYNMANAFAFSIVILVTCVAAGSEQTKGHAPA